MANLKDVHVLGDGVYLFELQQLKVYLSRPIFIGVCCLDFAKHFMTGYHYDKIVPYFGRDNVFLQYIDTDSFVWLIFTNDLYHDLLEFKDDFDFSSYSSDHPLYNTVNKSVRGKWKDEKSGHIIEECVFLRAKCYSMKMVDNKNDSMAAAGVRKAAQGLLTHRDYKDALFESTSLYVNQMRFGSVNHQMFTYRESKCALRPFDDKRYQINKFDSIPYGHYLLRF